MSTIYYSLRKLLVLPLILVALVLFGAIAMLLWNSLMPQLFHLPQLTFWQAVGLLILARLFFGGARPHYRGSWHGFPGKKSFREKMAKMTPEERKEFFRKLHEYKHFKDKFYWEVKVGGNDSKTE